jgi:hypothetical protein
MKKTYRIIPAQNPPGAGDVWAAVEQSDDVMDVREVSRHDTKKAAVAARAERERREGGSGQ